MFFMWNRISLLLNKSYHTNFCSFHSTILITTLHINFLLYSVFRKVVIKSKLKEQITNTIESGFYLSAFVAIVGLSVLGVIALNPKSVDDIETPKAQVAGLNTDDVSEQTNAIPIIMVTNESDSSVILNKTGDGIYGYSVNIPSIQEEVTENFELGTIKNLNDFDVTINLNFSVVGNVSDLLKIDIQDSVDVISILRGGTLTQRQITIPANSERTFELAVTASENINFPFAVFAEIK